MNYISNILSFCNEPVLNNEANDISLINYSVINQNNTNPVSKTNLIRATFSGKGDYVKNEDFRTTIYNLMDTIKSNQYYVKERIDSYDQNITPSYNKNSKSNSKDRANKYSNMELANEYTDEKVENQSKNNSKYHYNNQYQKLNDLNSNSDINKSKNTFSQGMSTLSKINFKDDNTSGFKDIKSEFEIPTYRVKTNILHKFEDNNNNNNLTKMNSNLSQHNLSTKNIIKVNKIELSNSPRDLNEMKTYQLSVSNVDNKRKKSTSITNILKPSNSNSFSGYNFNSTPNLSKINKIEDLNTVDMLVRNKKKVDLENKDFSSNYKNMEDASISQILIECEVYKQKHMSKSNNINRYLQLTKEGMRLYRNKLHSISHPNKPVLILKLDKIKTLELNYKTSIKVGNKKVCPLISIVFDGEQTPEKITKYKYNGSFMKDDSPEGWSKREYDLFKSESQLLMGSIEKTNTINVYKHIKDLLNKHI